jgi:hypothetical protein
MAITLTGDSKSLSPMFNTTSNPYSGNMYESMGGASRLTPSLQSILNPGKPQISTAEQLLKAAREKLKNAGGAARMKMREQEEQGVRSYVPADEYAANDELRTRASKLGIQIPVSDSFTGTGLTQLQQRPTGGVIASYGPQERVVSGKKGIGSAVIPTGDRKPATFDGMSREQFFGQAAARQGVDNKYARADKERVLAAIKKGGEKEKKKKAA